ncbi:hypothetical protein RJ640_026076 [Escallonia rubra]|uniref:Uncharacterized protein n=1 Tax=Escallonia rubra TaxID=112253 RepID=A0AA88QMJ5_9ASTE|nr:hypothetical protein RJ640_026076 [Escallonia rubra]
MAQMERRFPREFLRWTLMRRTMDDRAKNIISCGLDINEYDRVSACETAREMRRLLEVTHEGTNLVKESKIDMLVQQYEAFKMKENESTNEMYSRFTLIINGLKLLGKTYPEKEIIRKVLRSLPKRWETKVTAIQEAKDLNVLKLEELVGSLMTHEIMRKIHDEEETTLKKWNLTLKAEASKEPAESSDDSDQDMTFITQSDKKMSEDDDIAQLCFMDKDDHSDEVTTSENFDYDKLELSFLELSENHEKLKLKNAALKKKTLSLIDTVEELVSENEELDENFEFYITENAFLKNDLMASKKENSDLSSEIQSLRSVKTPVENELLKSQLEIISTQKGSLEKEIKDLNLTLSKFTQGRENL